MNDSGVNFLSIEKEGHTFVVIFRSDQVTEACRACSRYAGDKRLNLDWHDAMKLNQVIRQKFATA